MILMYNGLIKLEQLLYKLYNIIVINNGNICDRSNN